MVHEIERDIMRFYLQDIKVVEDIWFELATNSIWGWRTVYQEGMEEGITSRELIQ